MRLTVTSISSAMSLTFPTKPGRFANSSSARGKTTPVTRGTTKLVTLEISPAMFFRDALRAGAVASLTVVWTRVSGEKLS